MNITFLGLTTAGFYLLSGLAQGLVSFTQIRLSKATFFTFWLAALILHGILLYFLIEKHAGQDLSIVNMATLIMWVVSLILCGTVLRFPVDNLCLIVLPLSAISVLCALWLPSQMIINTQNNALFLTHIFVSILAYSLLCIAAVQAFTIAMQEYALRHYPSSRLIKHLPPIQRMERILFNFIWIGITFLSIALGSGLLYLEGFQTASVTHKMILSIFAWFIFVGLLWGRYAFGWRGRTAIYWTLGGFTLLMLGYFGSKMVIEWFLT